MRKTDLPVCHLAGVGSKDTILRAGYDDGIHCREVFGTTPLEFCHTDAVGAAGGRRAQSLRPSLAIKLALGNKPWAIAITRYGHRVSRLFLRRPKERRPAGRPTVRIGSGIGSDLLPAGGKPKACQPQAQEGQRCRLRYGVPGRGNRVAILTVI